MEREERVRKAWRSTGSREGLSEFSARLKARSEVAVICINIALIVWLIILFYEIVKKFFKEKEEHKEEPGNTPDTNPTRMLARRIKITRLDTSS